MTSEPLDRPAPDTIVLATHNAKKLTELRRIVDASGLATRVLGLGDVADYPEPDETEGTFEGNALIKARAAAANTGMAALADDSGIEVDVLNRMPGVRSARWAGGQKSDADNLDLLLAQVEDVPDEKRTARFVCAMALVLPDGTERVLRRTMEGSIAREKRGSNGFGYDPAFLPTGESRTTAEMSAEEKDAISHRGQAVRAMIELLASAPSTEGEAR